MPGKRKILRRMLFITLSLVLCLILAMAMSSCITIKLNSIRGSGDVTTKEFEVSDFNKLLFSGVGKIIIEQSDKESLTVEAEKNILETIDVNVSANRLNIGFKRGFLNVIPTKDIIFHLNVTDLQKIDLSGAGSVICNSFETESLSIHSSGLGNIEFGLIAEDLEINISGAGKVAITGEADVQEIEISGAGTYDGKDLISNDCYIEISGVGKASVNVIQTLDVRMSGVGNVEYTGNPAITQNISGLGGTVKSVK